MALGLARLQATLELQAGPLADQLAAAPVVALLAAGVVLRAAALEGVTPVVEPTGPAVAALAA